MKQLPSLIGWLLVLAALGLFVYGIGDAIFVSFPKSPSTKPLVIPEPLDVMVGTIGAILLTNLGAVLGISVSNPTSGLAKKILIQKADALDIPPPLNSREQVQYAALLIYLIAIVGCFITWAIKGFSSKPEEVVALIPQSGKTLIGVVSAYLAFILGVKQS